ncbi:Pyruvate kinase [anaerobic digester metagenome]
MILPEQKTRIVCTLGPVSSNATTIREMIRAGMSVARLNLSHGTLEEHLERIKLVRQISREEGRVVSLLIDLPGPKIRLGHLAREPVELERGAEIILTTTPDPKDPSWIPVEYQLLPSLVGPGSTIHINDGLVRLQVIEVGQDRVRTRVVVGGVIASRKGLNVVDGVLPVDAVTVRDLQFIEFGLSVGVNTFTISFIERAEEIRKARDHAATLGHRINVIAKIERKAAVEHLDELMEAADGIMVARGDLGVEMPIEQVPVIQKRIIRRANEVGIPVITATQMLESMTENLLPTRAEVTDVANAILDGSDAVMLSAETASGSYPVECVSMMARIARAVEAERGTLGYTHLFEDHIRSGYGHEEVAVEDVVSLNVIDAVRALRPRFILTPTHTGRTPRRIARFKPDCWVLAFCRDPAVYRYLSFSYGCLPFLVETEREDWHDLIFRRVKKEGLVESGDLVVLTEGVAPGPVGTTNSLRIVTID